MRSKLRLALWLMVFGHRYGMGFIYRIGSRLLKGIY